jgi:hypothetical protein
VLAALLGLKGAGLSLSTIARLKEAWKMDLTIFQGRDLSRKRYVYLWVDGGYFNVCLEGAKQCIWYHRRRQGRLQRKLVGEAWTAIGKESSSEESCSLSSSTVG